VSKEHSKSEDPFVTLYSEYWLKFASNTISLSLAAWSLLVPVYLLFLVPMARGTMAVVASIFVLVFVILMSALTDAKQQEIFMGAAAYAQKALFHTIRANN
jgi:hypothetical protein